MGYPTILLEADLVNAPGFTGVGTWDDLTPRAESITVRRGRNSELDRFEAGTIDALLVNPDGAIPLGLVQNFQRRNLLSNPSFEVNTTGVGINQGTIARIGTDARYGDWCLKTTVGAGGFGTNYAYIYQDGSISGATAGRVFQGSMYVKGEGQSVDKTVRVFLSEFGGASGEATGTDLTFTLREGWQRINCSKTLVQNDRTGVRIYIAYSDDAARQAGDYFLSDGWMIEEAAKLGPYSEGLVYTNKFAKPGRKVRFSAFHSESRNKVKNGEFKADVAGFNAYQNGQNATLAWDGGYNGPDGKPGVAKLTATSGPSGGGHNIGVVSGADYTYTVKCNPGEVWTATSYVRAVSVARSSIILVAFFDAVGAHIGTFSGTTKNDVVGDWTRSNDFTFTVPANARHFNVYTAFASVANGEIHLVDKVSAFEADAVPSAYEEWQGVKRSRQFVGYAEGWPPAKRRVKYDAARLKAVDALASIAGKKFTSTGTRALERTDQRIGYVLDQVGWSSTARLLDVGQANVIAYDFDRYEGMRHVYDCVDAEQGQFYQDKEGNAKFENRYKRSVTFVTSQATFDDQGAELPYEDIEVDFDWQLVAGEVKVGINDGVPQLAEDATSLGEYLERTKSLTLWLTSDAEALSVAQYLLARYKDPQVRVNKLVLDPTASSAVETQVLERDISDRITVKFRVGPTVFSGDYHIESIEHRIAPGKTWRTTWSLSPAEVWAFWVLDSATNSVLDVSTRVGY